MILNTGTLVLLQDWQLMMVQLNVGQCINVQPHCVVVFKPVRGPVDRGLIFTQKHETFVSQFTFFLSDHIIGLLSQRLEVQ